MQIFGSPLSVCGHRREQQLPAFPVPSRVELQHVPGKRLGRPEEQPPQRAAEKRAVLPPERRDQLIEVDFGERIRVGRHRPRVVEAPR
ncbi:MAG: hypothetical protein DMF89_04785 [Acidobacteria bacterium]|nr:MAG: hypothetical protein DMF89_04785 [Acidobacteriota bacterium]